ncbi:MAG: phage baseplate assembly protein V [Helicobacteraceae bacterium]|jgi:phage baseplate assembly protein V|nr:phage baseplate assembly protein V [Helicobacteraceae bacterium]
MSDLNIDELVRVGKIEEIDPENRSLARVRLLDRVTRFIPVLQFANSYKRHWTPLRVGEQTLVVSQGGDPDFGFAIRAIYNKGCKEPSGANDHAEVIEYEDGSRIIYDSVKKALDVFLAGSATIEITDDVTITSKANLTVHYSGDSTVKIDGDSDLTIGGSATIDAPSVTVDSPSIDLGVGGKGVVTQECFCAITGLPHPDGSTIARAAKQ